MELKFHASHGRVNSNSNFKAKFIVVLILMTTSTAFHTSWIASSPKALSKLPPLRTFYSRLDSTNSYGAGRMGKLSSLNIFL
jgi:hypothetical protein